MPRPDILRLILDVVSVEHPNDTARVHRFAHQKDLVQGFFCLLEFDCQEPSLAGLNAKILAAMEPFASEQLDTARLTTSLENLAVGFESFLKKIAVLKYRQDQLRLRGDGANYKGLLETTLGGLLVGEVARVNPRNSTLPPLAASIVTFDYTDTASIRNSVYNHTRELRNEIHEARSRSPLESLRLFQLTVAAYLFAVEENLALIRRCADPIFRHLDRLRDEFSSWHTRYIELFGEYRPDIALADQPELVASEWHDGPIAGAAEAAELMPSSAPHKVLALPAANRRFWLIGEPGAGKTTTLELLALTVADQALASGILEVPCPVFIRAALYDHREKLEQLIAKQLNVPVDVAESMLEDGTVQFLVDGLNELPQGTAEQGYAALERLLTTYPESPCVVTSRKFGFQNRFGLPVFELLPLSNADILAYLCRHLEHVRANVLFHELQRGQGLLLELARNPLMLSMLTLTAQHRSLPRNRGHLFRLFTRWIWDREAKRSNHSVDIKEHVLSVIAYRLRERGVLYIEKPIVVDWMKESLEDVRSNTDVFDLLRELIDNHLLESGPNDTIRFPHEMLLEYFCALQLRAMHLIGLAGVETDSPWREAVVMCSGLLPNATNFLKPLIEGDLLLAARCVASGAIADDALVEAVINGAVKMLGRDESEREGPCAALLELGADEGLRVIVKDAELDQYLEGALHLCERPELAALRLLRFGLTGRNCIYLCLKAVSRSWCSGSLLESDDVAKAQIALLDSSADSRELNLIARMGLSSRAVAAGINVASQFLKLGLGTSKWRAALNLTAANNFPAETRIGLKDILLSVEPSSPEEEYSFLLALKLIKDTNTDLKRLAHARALSCFSKGLFALGVKFVQLFHLQADLPAEAVTSYIRQLSDEGRLELTLDFADTFSAVNGEKYVEKAIDVLLARRMLEPIMQYKERIGHILQAKADVLKNVILTFPADSPLRSPRALIRFVASAGLSREFHDIGVVSTWVTNKGYGFVRSIATGECLFVHWRRFPRNCVPLIGQLVSFKAAVSAASEKRFREILSLQLLP